MSSTDAIVNLQIVNDSNIKVKSPAKTSETEFSMHLKKKQTKDDDKKSMPDFSALGFMNVISSDNLVVPGDSANEVAVLNDIVEKGNSVANIALDYDNKLVANIDLDYDNKLAANIDLDYDNKLAANIESLVNLIEEFQTENPQNETLKILNIDKASFEKADIHNKAQLVFDSVKTLIAQYTDVDDLLTKISDDPKQAVVELLELFEPQKAVVENNALDAQDIVNKIELAEDNQLPVKAVDDVEEKIKQIVMSDEAESVEVKITAENSSRSRDFSETPDRGEDKKATSGSDTAFNAKQIIDGPNKTVERFEYHIKNTSSMSGELRAAVADSIFSQYHINNEGNDEFILKLTPENLGTVTIKMEKLEEGLQIRIVTTDNAVKESITNQIAVIRENIEERGIKMNNIDVVLEQHTHSSFAQSGSQHFGNQSGRQLNTGTISTYTDEYDKQAIVEEEATSDNSVTTVNLYNSSVEFLA